MPLVIGAARKDQNEGAWHTYLDEQDGKPIRFKVRPWNRSAAHEMMRRVKDKDFVKSLDLDWDRLPKGSGNRRDELLSIVTAHYLIEDFENLVEEDGITPLECDIYSKARIFDAGHLQTWLFERGAEAGAKVVQDEAKN